MAANKIIRERYLEKYAEPEAQELWRLCQRKSALQNPEQEPNPIQTVPEFVRFFVLPAFDESIESLSEFLSMPSDGGLLSIWVLNAPESASDEESARTLAVFEHFLKELDARLVADVVSGNVSDLAPDPLSEQASGRCYLAELSKEHYLLLVDRCSAGRRIGAKQGVGLARKIGADIAVAMSCGDSCGETGARWIHFCDADVRLPPEYFRITDRFQIRDAAASGSARTKGIRKALPSALIYPFQHHGSDGLELESELYDFKLRYYVEQLAQAGSPYAYHALGSTMCINIDDYCKVRGVPKRPAGEDFYLLNKLAKLNGIVSLRQPELAILGRDSQRVPFGTGPALRKIAQHESALQDYRYYHPQSFKELGSLLFVLDNNAAHLDSQAFVSGIEHALLEYPVLMRVLAILGFERYLAHCRKQRLSGDKALRAFHDWFDAFLTLKFIHACRDEFYRDVPISDLLSLGAFLSDGLLEQYERIQHNWSVI